jgi:hypothetical protein
MAIMFDDYNYGNLFLIAPSIELDPIVQEIIESRRRYPFYRSIRWRY